MISKNYFLTAAVSALAGLFVGWQLSQPSDSADPPLATIAAAPAQVYTCPMHSEILAHEPGSCPICGMDLVESHDDHAHSDGDQPLVKIPAQVQNNLGVRTARVFRGDLEHRVETLGKITRIDLTARRIITPPTAGELIYIAEKYDGDTVRRGELLFSVISPKLREMQSRYQTAVNTGNQSAANTMIPDLRRAGLTPEQIAGLQDGAPPEIPVQVHSSEPGFVFSRRGKLGDQVPTGFTVFNLGGDYRVVEVTAEIFEREWARVEEGQTASMTLRGLPGRVFEGKVVRVEPPVGYTTRSLEVGLKFKTDDPGISQSMFAHVSIKGKTRRNLLLLPRDAVIRTGQGERVVVVRGNGFQSLPVVAGEESAGLVEIVDGLREGGKVVVSGQFLIDSESNLQAGLDRLSEVPSSRNDD